MTQKDVVKELLKQKGGILTSGVVKEAGVDYKTLQRMSQDGDIERVEHGLYMDPNQM
jgi:predicted transcriptional regulator of viral defense system